MTSFASVPQTPLAEASATRIHGEWSRRVEAEYASGAITAQLVHWLFQVGVSPDTISDANAIVVDELYHAALSSNVLIALSERRAVDDEPLGVRPDLLVLPRHPATSLLDNVLRVAIQFYCCGETLARPLFREMLRGALVPEVTTALTQIVKDEARHSAFGWALLDELWPLASAAAQAAVKSAVAPMLQRLIDGYGGLEAGAPKTARVSEVEAAWGLLSRRRYIEITQHTVDDVIRPRLVERIGPL